MGCILFQLATTVNRLAFRDDWSVLEYFRGYDVCPQVDLWNNSSLSREFYCREEKSKTSCLSQINSAIALCLAREPSARATAMKLKVTFERMKAFLMDEMDEEDRKRWL